MGAERNAIHAAGEYAGCRMSQRGDMKMRDDGAPLLHVSAGVFTFHQTVD